MSRTYRTVDAWMKGAKWERGSDRKPLDSKCLPNSKHPKGFDTFEDDHGHYGAGGSKSCKKLSSRARRIYSDNITNAEIKDHFND